MNCGCSSEAEENIQQSKHTIFTLAVQYVQFDLYKFDVDKQQNQSIAHMLFGLGVFRYVRFTQEWNPGKPEKKANPDLFWRQIQSIVAF